MWAGLSPNFKKAVVPCSFNNHRCSGTSRSTSTHMCHDQIRDANDHAIRRPIFERHPTAIFRAAVSATMPPPPPARRPLQPRRTTASELGTMERHRRCRGASAAPDETFFFREAKRCGQPAQTPISESISESISQSKSLLGPVATPPGSRPARAPREPPAVCLLGCGQDQDPAGLQRRASCLRQTAGPGALLGGGAAAKKLDAAGVFSVGRDRMRGRCSHQPPRGVAEATCRRLPAPSLPLDHHHRMGGGGT